MNTHNDEKKTPYEILKENAEEVVELSLDWTIRQDVQTGEYYRINFVSDSNGGCTEVIDPTPLKWEIYSLYPRMFEKKPTQNNK